LHPGERSPNGAQAPAAGSRPCARRNHRLADFLSWPLVQSLHQFFPTVKSTPFVGRHAGGRSSQADPPLGTRPTSGKAYRGPVASAGRAGPPSGHFRRPRSSGAPRNVRARTGEGRDRDALPGCATPLAPKSGFVARPSPSPPLVIAFLPSLPILLV